MKYIINNLRLPINEDESNLKPMAAKSLGIKDSDIKDFKLVKQSLDARRKSNINMVYSVVVDTDACSRNTFSTDIQQIFTKPQKESIKGSQKIKNRPVVVGTGPAGLLAGLLLAQNGYKPILLERGECVEKTFSTRK